MDSNRDMSKTVTIPGELHSVASGNVVAASEEIFDYKTNSYQSDLNSDSLSYNVSVHHPEKDFYTLDEAVRLVPDEFKIAGLKLTFNTSNNEVETYFYNGTNKDDFFNEDKWGSSVGKYIYSSEYLQVTLDSSNKVLDCIKTNGDHEIYTNVNICGAVNMDGSVNIGGSVNMDGSVNIGGSVNMGGNEYYIIDNDEWIRALIDGDNKIICGITYDGKFYCDASLSDERIERIMEDIENINDKLNKFNDIIYIHEHPDFISAELDADDKVLGGRKEDGTMFEKVGIDLGDSISGLDLGSATLSSINDPEKRIDLETDNEDKIIKYRKEDGTLVENVGIETNKLTFTEQGMTDFQKALKDAGFNPGGGGDYSDTITEKGKKPVYIPMPRLARVNIIWDGNLTTLSKKDRGGTQKVNYDVKVPVEFFDGQGIYFKKYALMSAQGNSSMDFIKKNISLKFFDTEDVEGKKKKWGKGDTFGTVFGDWVMQKTYHLKAFYTDFIRGGSEVAYQLADEVYKTRGIYADRPWKKALIDFSKITSVTPTNLSKDGSKDMNLQIDNGARCMPDGFPVIVYQNGEFYGIFIWMLKKDADNFNMETDNPLHIHIDGELYVENLWGGTINWTKFEVRNPENLCYKILHNGTYKYDADVAQDEIAGIEDNTIYLGNWTAGSYDVGKVVKKDSDYFINMVANNTAEPVTKAGDNKNTAKDPDFENKTGCGWVNCTITVKVKQYIIDLSNRVGQINALTPTYTRPDETVITLNEYKGTHNIDNSYSRGNWVMDPQSSGTYYMSLHNIDGTSETKYPLSDETRWVDVTSDITAIKAAIETYFDIDNLVDYEVINMAVGDPDGFGKNWQWTTWDGVKWYANQYDKDMAFGNYWTGMFTTAPKNGWLSNDTNLPSGLAIRYYTPEHKARWQELVNAGIFNAEHIKSMITAWISRIGKDNFVQEWKKWAESPCNRNSKIDFEYWRFTGGASNGTPSSGTIWNASTSYDIGNTVWFKVFDGNWYLQFKSVKAGSNKPCLTSSYTTYPKSMGYRDSAWRFYKYIEETISNQNTFINSL